MRLVWHGEKVTRKAMAGADAFCSQVATDIVGEAKLGMKGPRSGAVPPQGKRIPGWMRLTAGATVDHHARCRGWCVERHPVRGRDAARR